MKLSDFIKRQEETDNAWESRRRERLTALADELDKKDIPAYVSKDSWDKTIYANIQGNMRDQLRAGKAIILPDVECDHCGTQLINRSPGTILTSIPPQISVGCPGCGWLGSMPA
jgi:hypothetical protein